MALDAIQKALLAEIAGLHGVPEGAYNIRSDGKLEGRSTTANIDIVTKSDKPGIDIYIKPGTRNESVHIPVIIEQSGLKDLVYNDFHIGEGADVTIIAGCGINNCGSQDSQHDGIHSFYVGKNARLKYVEKHYADGDGSGERIMNPTTIIELDEGAYNGDGHHADQGHRLHQARHPRPGRRGRDADSPREADDPRQAGLRQRVHDRPGRRRLQRQRDKPRRSARRLAPGPAAAHNGNARCYGHSECDNIVMDESFVQAIPEITANSVEASLSTRPR